MASYTLFPELLDEPEITPEPPLARASDPETSHLGADYIRERRGPLHQAIIDTLRAAKEPMTAKEIGPDAHKRMLELCDVKDPLIEVCGKRKCSVTGRMAQVYRIMKGSN